MVEFRPVYINVDSLLPRLLHSSRNAPNGKQKNSTVSKAALNHSRVEEAQQ